MKRFLWAGALSVLAILAARVARRGVFRRRPRFLRGKSPAFAGATLLLMSRQRQKQGRSQFGLREAMLKGGDSAQPAVVAGAPDQSPLIVAVQYHDAVKMPKKYKLKDAEIAVLVAWVKRGAPWPAATGEAKIRAGGDSISPEERAFWSFRPVADPPAPVVKNAGWCKDPLDHFILSKLERRVCIPCARRQADAAAPGDVRSDRLAADAGRDRRISQ